MSGFVRELANTSVAAGTVHAWWLGGTGFIFKTHAGTTIYVDPYLSNVVAQIFGVERGFPPPITAQEARPDLVISTHWHEDHLDPSALPIIAQQSDALFMTTPSAQSRLLSWGIPRERLQPIVSGDTREFRDVQVMAVPARHLAGIPGWETPDALGVILDFDGVRVYHSGDTEYDLRLRALAHQNIHAALVVINGAGGNMNAHEAALLVWQLGAQVVIPMHHLLWKDFSGGPDATLDPTLFETTYKKLGGQGEVRLLQVGEGTVLARSDSHRGNDE